MGRDPRHPLGEAGVDVVVGTAIGYSGQDFGRYASGSNRLRVSTACRSSARLN